jgi:NAD(P)-dependent dehydrogenase (short-subunit alcohol dehydrogenase family)
VTALRERVSGRTALVTGAGNGLGRAIALALARSGARVILVGRTEQTLQAVATEIACAAGSSAAWSGSSRSARVAVADTSAVDDVHRLAADLAGENVSILVNNAGVAGPVAALVDVAPAEWDDVFAVNVRGVYLMCRAFLPPMIAAGRGDVINVASVSGKRPLARRTPYTASKMAVIGLTTTLAHEVGPLGVMVNSLSPGPVRGPRMERNFQLEAEQTGSTLVDAEQAFVSRAALGRMVTPEEVGDAVIAMLHMPGLAGADIDLSAGMAAR